jgi:hypothetical protein
MGEEGAKPGMEVHGNEYHDPDFEQEGAAAGLVVTHEGKSTGVHGVAAGTVAKVGDIAVDANLSAAAQDAVNKRHTQNTDAHLGTVDQDIPLSSHKLTGLSVPANAGDSIRATAKITEGNLEDAIDKKHAQAHKATHEPGGGDAMAVDAAAATGSLRTLGTGALQAAAGTHTHTLATDANGAATGAVLTGSSGTYYRAGSAIAAETYVTIASFTLACAATAHAYAAGCLCASASVAGTISIELYIANVFIASSLTLNTTATIIYVGGFKAASGNTLITLKAYNADSSSRTYYCFGPTASLYRNAYLSAGSVKI